MSNTKSSRWGLIAILIIGLAILMLGSKKGETPMPAEPETAQTGTKEKAAIPAAPAHRKPAAAKATPAKSSPASTPARAPRKAAAPVEPNYLDRVPAMEKR